MICFHASNPPSKDKPPTAQDIGAMTGHVTDLNEEWMDRWMGQLNRSIDRRGKHLETSGREMTYSWGVYVYMI